MTNEDKDKARKFAQEKLSAAHKLLDEAAELANTHRFDLEFMGSVYVPEGATSEESRDNDWPVEIGYDEVVPGEWWMPSTC